MDELFLRNERKSLEDFSSFEYRARKRAQGSPCLCNRDYAAAYVEVDRQVGPEYLLTAFTNASKRTFEYQKLELTYIVQVRETMRENYA